MHRPRPALPTVLVLAVVGALAAVPAAAPARAEQPVIYKWVDENGVAHYTTDRDRIPSAIRDRVIQSGDAARGADWLRRDAGPPGAAPAPAQATPPTAAVPREAADVERPEDVDGVHAVEAQPDWSQAPGGEATWAPGDLGEDGQQAPVDAAPAQAAPAQAAPAPPAATRAAPASEAPEAEAATHAYAPPPPPPPPPLEADGAPVAPVEAAVPAAADAPVATSAIPRDAEPAPVPAPLVVDDDPAAAAEEPPLTGEPVAASPAVEPPAPAAVAAPAPRELAPDEQEQLAALDAQIAEVEAKIARDEEAMMVLISGTEGEAAPQGALVDDARFRDIAQRLPKLQADLERLRERRAQIQPAVPTP